MMQPRDALPPSTDQVAAEAVSVQPTLDDVMATGPHLDPHATKTFHAPGASRVEGVWPELPGYVIDGVLGRGGMGVVYKARHLALKRTVALKMILTGSHAGEQERARFKAEAEAVARLQHPNIVQIYEVGKHDGRLYCALEFVEGGNLARKLGGNALPAREAARLVEALAGAIQLAHSRNIIHRDLKPANVLLNGEGTPKITDFGLARQLDVDSGQTEAGQVLGTPSYMAPEQAAGLAHLAGPAADTYALGAILYECLTGWPPFKGGSVLETLELVRSCEPAAPHTLERKVPRDLETVCLKCLRKQPESRYASASALGEDLRRWQAGEPILARPVGKVERGVKWVRRNPAVALLLALVVLAVAGGIGAFTVKYVEAQDQAEIANTRRYEAEKALKEKDKALVEAQEQLAANAIIMAQVSWEKGEVGAAQAHLDRVPEKPHTLRNFEWHYLRRQYEGGIFTLRGHTGAVTSVAFSSDGKRIATASHDNTARLWDVRTGALDLELKAGMMLGVVFSPDGTRVATANADNTARVWDARTGALMVTLNGHTGSVLALAYSPDGSHLATASADNTARLWDAHTGDAVLILKGHASFVECVAFSPDGKYLATASRDCMARLWDARTGTLIRLFKGHMLGVKSVAFSPDGTRLATGSYDGTACLWDAHTGALLRTLKSNSYVWGVAFSPDGASLATANVDATTRLWDARSGDLILTLKGHTRGVLGVAFSPDGTRLATASQDETARLWDARLGTPVLTLKGNTARVNCVAFSPNGKRIATANSHNSENLARLWDGRTGALVLELKGHAADVKGVAFSPVGTLLATASEDTTARLWDIVTGAFVLALKGHTDGVMSVAFSPDGTRLATASADKTVRLWDAGMGAFVLALKGHTGGVTGVAFSPDGTRLASVSEDKTARLWDARTGALVLDLKGHTDGVMGVAFSPDGMRLATASRDHTVRLWDAQTGALISALTGHNSSVTGVAFSLDGTRVASASFDGTAKLWDARTGALILNFKGHTGVVLGVAFSPDGTRLATSSSDSTARLWDGCIWQTDAVEIGYREWATRPEPDWHAAEADRLERAGLVFAANFHLRRLLDLQPDGAVFLLRGRSFNQEPDDGPLVLAAHDAAIRKAPGNVALRLRRAMLCSRLGQFQEARTHLDHAAALAKVDPAVMLTRSLLEGRAGRTKQARIAREQALLQTATVLALDAEHGWEGRRRASAPAKSLATDTADTVLVVEEELGWERRVSVIDAARTIAIGGHLSGPVSAALTLKFGRSQPLLSAPEAATAWQLCGLVRCGRGEWQRAAADLDAALAQAASDVSIRRARARAYAEMAVWHRTIADCTACLKIQPKVWELWYLRGLAYRQLREPERAAADLTQARARGGDGLAVRREQALALADFANVLTRAGRLDEAVTVGREAVRVDPSSHWAQQNLGWALLRQGKWDGAIAAYRATVRLDPDNMAAHHELGISLAGKGLLEEAIAAYRQAIKIDSKHPDPQNDLGQTLLALGRYSEARQSTQAWLKVLPANDASQPNAAYLLRLAELGERLPALLKGDEGPTGATQRIDMADLCRRKRHYATAVRLCTEAFADQTKKLAEDLRASHRYNAACYAVLAGCGVGEDAASLNDTERTKLRKQALAWLRSDLALWTKQLAGGKPQDRQQVAARMRHWQQDSALAGLREPAAVAKLPADEREACKALWTDVAALLRKEQAPPSQ